MSEREQPRPRESILGKEFVEPLLGAAQMNLAKDGELVPALFLHIQGGERMAVLLENFPQDSDAKQLYLAAVGITLQGSGRQIEEAVFLCEVWYVEQRTDEGGLEEVPRRHPKRREALVVMGRNRQRSRFTHVLQPFHRDRKNQPVFEKEVLTEYNVAAETTPQADSLLDHLFVGERGNGAA